MVSLPSHFLKLSVSEPVGLPPHDPWSNLCLTIALRVVPSHCVVGA
jgi:hypothetical protein